MLTVRQVLVNSLWSLLTFGTSLIFGMVVAVILPNILSVGQYGEYGYYFRVFSWVGSLGALFVPPAIFRYLPELEIASSNKRQVVQQALLSGIKYQIVISLIISLFTVVYFWYERADFSGSVYVIAGLMVIVSGFLLSFQSVGRSYLEAMQQYRSFTRISIYSSLVKLVVLAAIIVLGLKTAVYCFGTVLLEQIVAVALMVATIGGRWQPGKVDMSEHKAIFSRMKDYGLSMGVGGLFSLITWGYIEVFMIKAIYRGTDVMEQISYYCLAVSLATMLVRVVKNITSPLTTFFVQHRATGNYEAIERGIRKSMILTILAGGGGMMFLFLFSHDIFSLVFQEGMSPARLPFVILLIPSAILCLALPFGPLQVAYERHKYMMWISIMSAGVNLLLDIILIPKHGALGAALVNCIVQGVVCLTGMSYIIVTERVKMPYGDLVKVFSGFLLICLAIWQMEECSLIMRVTAAFCMYSAMFAVTARGFLNSKIGIIAGE